MKLYMWVDINAGEYTEELTLTAANETFLIAQGIMWRRENPHILGWAIFDGDTVVKWGGRSPGKREFPPEAMEQIS